MCYSKQYHCAKWCNVYDQQSRTLSNHNDNGGSNYHYDFNIDYYVINDYYD
jgi:hypothetical protein